MLRIRDVYPGSDFFLSRIPDLGSEFFHPGSRIRIKEFKYFNPKKCFIISRKLGNMVRVFHPGSRSGSSLFIHPGSRIHGSKRHRIPDPGSGSQHCCAHWSTDLPGLHFEPFKASKFCKADPDQAYFSYADPDPDPASKNNADLDPKPLKNIRNTRTQLLRTVRFSGIETCTVP